jgi:hypothetical protein
VPLVVVEVLITTVRKQAEQEQEEKGIMVALV